MSAFKYDIIVIGTGGTGSYFLKEFSRFVSNSYISSSFEDGGISLGSLTLCDGDVVEEHNLERQAFSEDDIGEKKAVALAEALHDCFGVSWNCYPEYIENPQNISELLDYQAVGKVEKVNEYSNIHVPVIIGCVDNHGCRLICEKFFKEATNCIYFDSANEFVSGEVVFSYKLNGVQVSPLRSEIFPEIKEGDTRNVTEMSCAELNVHSPQHIATNMRAGNLLLVAMTRLLQEQKLYPGVTFFDIEQMSEEFILKQFKEV